MPIEFIFLKEGEAMNGKALIEYFRQAMELESTIHCQEQILEEITQFKSERLPRPQKPTNLTDKTLKQLEKERWALRWPENPVDKLEKPQKPILVVSILFIYGFVIALCVFLFLLMFWKLKYFFISFAVLYGAYLIYEISSHQSKIKEYDRQMEDYHAKAEKLRQEYAKEEAAHKAKLDEYDKAIEEAKNAINAKYEKDVELHKQKRMDGYILELRVQEEGKRLAAAIDEAKQTLQLLYNANVIYPKYRNLVAVCTIYEYLESKRCTELEGANGAYNLFESELRQDLIISKLDEVIDNMRIIQRNQFQLYKKLDAIDKTVKGIQRSLKEIASNTQAIAKDVAQINKNTAAIAHSSQITALSSVVTSQCAAIAAQNTEAIKYIALIN